jgi:hypothetical protein
VEVTGKIQLIGSALVADACLHEFEKVVTKSRDRPWFRNWQSARGSAEVEHFVRYFAVTTVFISLGPGRSWSGRSMAIAAPTAPQVCGCSRKHSGSGTLGSFHQAIVT